MLESRAATCKTTLALQVCSQPFPGSLDATGSVILVRSRLLAGTYVAYLFRSCRLRGQVVVEQVANLSYFTREPE